MQCTVSATYNDSDRPEHEKTTALVEAFTAKQRASLDISCISPEARCCGVRKWNQINQSIGTCTDVMEVQRFYELGSHFAEGGRWLGYSNIMGVAAFR